LAWFDDQGSRPVVAVGHRQNSLVTIWESQKMKNPT
jgi:hypothetical protein